MDQPTETRRCKTCRQVKPLDQFYFTGKGRLYRHWTCAECLKAQARTDGERSKRLIRAYSRAPKRHPIDLSRPVKGPTGRRGHPLSHHFRLWHDAILHYGGYKCACCGITEPAFLTLDHINNGGTRHRRELKRTGRSFFAWLRDNGYPPGFQVLCINCNQGRHRNGGICPHKQARQSPKG